MLAQASCLNLATAAMGRRSAITGAAAAALFQLPRAAFAQSREEKAQATLREASVALHAVLDNKEAFITAFAEGKGVVPAQVPFTTFQLLENTAEPEFMEVAIDYAEASRSARDLLKLAKLTKQNVEVSVKEAGKARRTELKEYGEAEGSGLSTAKEYADRAAEELLAASICLDKAITVMIAAK